MNTTLSAIREHNPCTNGWKKLLSHLEKTKADDELLPITTILDSNGVEDALWCLRAVGGRDREIRLYAVWCARQVQHLMADQRSINALDVAVRHANGTATDDELAAARAAARAAAWAAAWDAASAAAWAAASAAARDAAWAAASAAARDAAWDAAWDAARDAARAAASAAARDAAWDAAWDAASNVQAKELRRVCDCISAGQDPYPFKEAE